MSTLKPRPDAISTSAEGVVNQSAVLTSSTCFSKSILSWWGDPSVICGSTETESSRRPWLVSCGSLR
jgi:hypothetical protein